MNKRDFFYILIILISLFFAWRSSSKAKEFSDMYNASVDTLHQTRNDLNQQVTTTALLYGSVSDLKKLHASDSSALSKLQQMVDKLTISATYLSTITGNTIYSATTVIQRDTILKDGVSYLYPEYRDTISNKWENFIMAANKDSFKLQYKLFNEFELKQSWKKNGIFKRRTPIAEITNLNPNTETKEFKTFTIKENKGNRLRDGIIGAAIGAALVGTLNVLDIRIPISFK